MTHRVLVVCTANVCRSPTTALLLQRRLDGAGLGPLVELRTAGTDPSPGAGYCPVVADVVGPSAGGLLTRHRSRPLERRALEEADLVLVMERAHRAAVAAMAPSATPRTFTLREAAALAGSLSGARSGAGSAGRGAEDLRGFVRAMHDARGSTVPAGHVRSLAERLRRADVVDPLDVPDAHVRRETGHEQVLAFLDEAVEEWVDGLLG